MQSSWCLQTLFCSCTQQPTHTVKLLCSLFNGCTHTHIPRNVNWNVLLCWSKQRQNVSVIYPGCFAIVCFDLHRTIRTAKSTHKMHELFGSHWIPWLYDFAFFPHSHLFFERPCNLDFLQLYLYISRLCCVVLCCVALLWVCNCFVAK